ncbi:GTP-binding protein, partial [Pseudomonas syringae group genomosp. 7]|uniref:GTP-binding protein n=1 Tax=Pseudomonas syringae group genomosp. 7 TaxID=251699 RepID=UPI003770557D
RKFIIAETPGHEQNTRNMATGASTCDLAMILVDARYGEQSQPRRHRYFCTKLRIKQIVVAINKKHHKRYDHTLYESNNTQYQNIPEPNA